MDGVLELDKSEIREIFGILRNKVDEYFIYHHPIVKWALYDKLAFFLGENLLADHLEALRLQAEEEREDARREAAAEAADDD